MLVRASLAAAALLCASTAAFAAPAEKRFGAVVAPVRLVPAEGTTISVHGMASYFGGLEIDSYADGLVLSNRLTLERYLWGLNEVPTAWPFEALKAQAIAARTYALHSLASGRAGEGAVYGYDICATVQCQVFSGADVALASGGSRWVEAVRATDGIAITYGGAPILARYHSVSGGHTLDNEVAFPDEPAYPYLQGVPSPTEDASPLFRWTVTFPLRRVQEMLARQGWWSRGHGRLVEVTSAGDPFSDVTLTFRGRRGSFTVSAPEWRDSLRELAPRMWPNDYPSAGGTGRLPETLPSHRISVFTDDRSRVRVVGRGWGHGSGMSQWGAFGLALRGASAAEILSHYYTGVGFDRLDTDRPIEVGVGTALPRVTVTGRFSVADGAGRVLVREALGTWSFGWAGEGAVAIDPPEGFGLPLRVAVLDAPRRVELGTSADLTVALSRPARVHLDTRGAPLEYSDPGTVVKDAGRQRITWHAPLEPGIVTVRVRAVAGSAARTTEPIEIEVFERPLARAEGAPRRAPEDTPGSDGRWLLVGVGLLLLAAVIAALFRPSKPPPQEGPR